MLAGLKEVVRYCRCGDNWKKLLSHMSILAGEENACFRDSLLHAYLADEINWAAKIDEDPDLVPSNKEGRRKGYKVILMLPPIMNVLSHLPLTHLSVAVP